MTSMNAPLAPTQDSSWASLEEAYERSDGRLIINVAPLEDFRTAVQVNVRAALHMMDRTDIDRLRIDGLNSHDPGHRPLFRISRYHKWTSQVQLAPAPTPVPPSIAVERYNRAMRRASFALVLDKYDLGKVERASLIATGVTCAYTAALVLTSSYQEDMVPKVLTLLLFGKAAAFTHPAVLYAENVSDFNQYRHPWGGMIRDFVLKAWEGGAALRLNLFRIDPAQKSEVTKQWIFEQNSSDEPLQRKKGGDGGARGSGFRLQ